MTEVTVQAALGYSLLEVAHDYDVELEGVYLRPLLDSFGWKKLTKLALNLIPNFCSDFPPELTDD